MTTEAKRAVSTPRVRKHAKMLAALGLRYRNVLMHDDDVARIRAYAARLLKSRRTNQE